MAPTLQSGTGKWVTFRMTGGGATMILTLPINPEELQKTSPARITTTQTLGGVYQDIDGIGVTNLTLQGTTGWRGRPGANMDGLQYAQHLYKYIYEEYYRRVKAGATPEMQLIDGVNGYQYQITIDDFQMFRNKSEPLLFRYTLPLTVIRDLNDPPNPPVDVPQQTVGNPGTNTSTSKTIATQQNKQPPRTYIVKSGDNLWVIAQKFYGANNGPKYTVIAAANHIVPPYTIYPGQKLVIPYI